MLRLLVASALGGGRGAALCLPALGTENISLLLLVLPGQVSYKCLVRGYLCLPCSLTQ